MKKLIFLLCLFFTTSAFAQQQEEILSYIARIYVHKNASVLVKERISVLALGHQIKRGIYRDLPLTKGVSYHVRDVKKNGEKEPFFITKPQRKYRINLGDDTFLQAGNVYTYEITYTASNVILGFEDYDEFYWNVTGDEWAFPIQRVWAKVFLPDNAPTNQSAVYIGKKGSKERGDKDVHGAFISSRPLKRGEGLTIALGFDKGIVNLPPNAPNLAQKEVPQERLYFIWSLFFSFLFFTWYLYGKDPESRAIMPRFDGVMNFTPAQAARIFSYGQDNELYFSLALLQSAISGFFQINEDEKKDFIFKKKRAPKNEEEKLLNSHLSGDSFCLTKRYNPEISNAMIAFTKAQKETDELYFIKNTKFFALAVLLFIGLFNWMGHLTDNSMLTSTLTFYLAFFIPLFLQAFHHFIIKKTPKFSFLFILIFISFHSFMMLKTSVNINEHSFQVILFFIIGVICLVLYKHFIISPKEKGQNVIEHLKGIKMFLKALNPTQSKTINLTQMEKLLPYAVFFGLEKQWEKKMERLSPQGYQPHWYSGAHFSRAQMQRMNKACRTTTQPPSSSGSRGGGSSGGGFGGGGGGGR